MSHPTIHDLETLETIISPQSRPLCLYSGGLDGTYLLYRLSKLSCSHVIALTVDLGGDLQRKAIQQLVHSLGAQHIIEDHRSRFAQDFVLPALAAQASYLGGHPICASLSRPLMAHVACEVAQANNCDMIIHTSNRSQNSLRRFNGALGSLGFRGHFGSPFELSLIPREIKGKELSAAGIHVSLDNVHSIDTNLWGREFEYGAIDDPEQVNVPEHLYKWTTCSDSIKPTDLSISFIRGIPVALNDKMDAIALIQELNGTVGAYGLGRYIGLEEIEGGVKVQEVREMPAAYLLLDAYRRLETACLPAECIREKMTMEQLWVREAIEGRWYGSLRLAAQSFIQTLAQEVTGSVSYQLDRNKIQVTSVKAEKPLYIRDRNKYEQDQNGEREGSRDCA